VPRPPGEPALGPDEGADALAGLQQPLGAQQADRLAQGGQADPEPLGQFGLGGQPAIRLESAGLDVGAQRRGDLHVLRNPGSVGFGHRSHLRRS
jgi:hypothetical protein